MFARHAMVFAVFAIAACPRDQDTPPENDTGTSNASNDTSGTATLTTTTSPTTQGTEESGPVDTSGGESTTGEVVCLGPMDCWNCDAVAPEQLLNHCTNADCEPFENTPERLPLLERDGSLPPIP